MESQNYEQSSLQEAEAYYKSIPGLDARTFIDLDAASNLDYLIHSVKGNDANNFLLDFNDATARVSFDLSTPSIDALVKADRPEAISVRWINIWKPHSHRSLLQALAKHFDFSPRLLALMISEPRFSCQQQTSQRDLGSEYKIFKHRSPTPSMETEVEKGLDELAEYDSFSNHDSVQQGNLYRIIDDLWHYSSVDLGRNYVCIGYNSLYGTKCAGSDDAAGPLPHCTRVWTWLLLCDDNTVISINEDPFPFSEGRLSQFQDRIVAETRRNLVNVFRSLSKVETGGLMANHPMTVFPIRLQVGSTPEETVHRQSDAPGLLFYSLFENWHNSYTLITRRDSRFGVEFAKLRAEMFESPKLCHIDRLDSIGTELGVLRRHYESYKRLIDRLLEPQVATSASLANSRILSEASQASSIHTVRPVVITEKESLLGVSFTSAARVRFKRLQDVIDLYALSEIEEYIKQKDSMVAMNFNLIAIKESLDVERLTRITLLLTKITILFLPVSLMTSYFSVQLVDMMYNVTQYWVSFAVILFFSWIILLVVGIMSGSVETVTIWRKLWNGLKMNKASLRARAQASRTK